MSDHEGIKAVTATYAVERRTLGNAAATVAAIVRLAELAAAQGEKPTARKDGGAPSPFVEFVARVLRLRADGALAQRCCRALASRNVPKFSSTFDPESLMVGANLEVANTMPDDNNSKWLDATLQELAEARRQELRDAGLKLHGIVSQFCESALAAGWLIESVNREIAEFGFLATPVGEPEARKVELLVPDALAAEMQRILGEADRLSGEARDVLGALRANGVDVDRIAAQNLQ